jgi:hypothetical protein
MFIRAASTLPRTNLILYRLIAIAIAAGTLPVAERQGHILTFNI